MQSASAMDLFVRVVGAGTFSAAAREMGVPTSTVSRRVTRLEERLGVQLLLRSTRKLTPTDVGRAYYERCKHLVAQISETELAVTSMQTEPRGVLRIAGPPTGGPVNLLAKIIPVFMVRYPEVRIELEASARFVHLVEEGFDVALRAGVLKDPTLIARRLWRSRVGAVASTSYLDRAGRPESVADLTEHDLLVGINPGAIGHWNLLDGGRFAVTGRLTTKDLTVISEATRAGLGIGYVPLGFVAEELESGSMERVLPDTVGIDTGLYIVYPGSRYLSAKVRAFVDFCIEYIDTLNLPGAPGADG
jgi:DNA-binding transcriptional LysR family regulator